MNALRLHIAGTVQGVGFRPFVFRLATTHGLAGWVRNGDAGVEIHVEGSPASVDDFARDLRTQLPAAASIGAIDLAEAPAMGARDFRIVESTLDAPPTTRISPDLPTCADCVAELLGDSPRRRGHAYIACTQCGPRWSIMAALPYDRSRTTMRHWPMCNECVHEYDDPADRRFHAQTQACNRCGPSFVLIEHGVARARGEDAVRETARRIAGGGIVAVKGLGGYHLACDAANPLAVAALRERKYRKERPFAIMARHLDTARDLVDLSPDAEALLLSAARPIVLAPARVELLHVAPGTRELGVMLPYAPIHHLLFAAGAPDALVMTSGNRSSDPIAYEDDDALARLAGIADAVLVGERPIARRVDDSVVRAGASGPQILRRARGYAPGAVARIPLAAPTLAVGADLKNTVTLVVGGDAIVCQHIGDLEQASADLAFRETIRDLLAMYDVDVERLEIVHDLHPQYASTTHALELPARARRAVQHHRAHVASVLAERAAFETRVIGVAFDGTGFGDDGTIWGGELLAGSIVEGFERVGHLRGALLPGGDAAARHPVQAAAGFLAQLESLPDLAAPPFSFPRRWIHAWAMVEKGVRTFPTTSVGRLFDTVAALCGFARECTFEGQAAMWLEQLAARDRPADLPGVEFRESRLDFRPVLQAVIDSRLAGRAPGEIARGFHVALACGVADAVLELCETHGTDTVVLSGGVFQNDLLVHDVAERLAAAPIRLWMNRGVPPNDGGISLGQAASALAWAR